MKANKEKNILKRVITFILFKSNPIVAEDQYKFENNILKIQSILSILS
jgi:hypothetical protein